MDYESFLNYSKAIEPLKASELLDLIKVYCYPNSKKENQTKIHRDLVQKSNPDLFDKPKKVVSLDDVARMLARG
jgi:hypothetical protein